MVYVREFGLPIRELKAGRNVSSEGILNKRCSDQIVVRRDQGIV